MKATITSLGDSTLRLIEKTAGNLVGAARDALDAGAKIRTLHSELTVRESVGGESYALDIMFELGASKTDLSIVFLRIFVLHRSHEAATAGLKLVLAGVFADYVKAGNVERCTFIRSEHPDEDGILWVMRITR